MAVNLKTLDFSPPSEFLSGTAVNSLAQNSDGYAPQGIMSSDAALARAD